MAAKVLPDPLATFAALIIDGFNVDNVDASLPTITVEAEVKTLRAAKTGTNRGDRIHIYTVEDGSKSVYIDYQFRDRNAQIAVDVESLVSREHHRKILAEIERIVDVNRTNPPTLPAGSWGYDRIDTSDWTPLSSKSTKRWRDVAHFTLASFTEPVAAT